MVIAVAEIADQLNSHAVTLAPELLPNGHKAGNKWMASGIADTGGSASLYVHLSGPKIGHWRDMGNCPAGEEKGDMIDLLRLKLGLDAKGAVDEAKRRLGIQDSWQPAATRPSREELERRAAAVRERQAARTEAEQQERAAKARGAIRLYLHQLARPIAGTPVEAYLRGRGLGPGEGAWPNALRFHPEVWCRAEGVKIPAMLAPIYNAAGQQIGLHRTFLQDCARRGWVKIDSPNAKMVLGNMWGGFIPLNKGSSGKSMAQMPAGEAVYVTEGIEDGLVVRMIRPEARIIAAISLPNMGGIVLPEAARDLILVCDRDEKPQAQAALERAIATQQARGLPVRLVFPPPPHKDMNDWLRARGQAA